MGVNTGADGWKLLVFEFLVGAGRLFKAKSPVQVEIAAGSFQKMAGRFLHDGSKFSDEMALVVVTTAMHQFAPGDTRMVVEQTAGLVKAKNFDIHLGTKAQVLVKQTVYGFIAVAGMAGKLFNGGLTGCLGEKIQHVVDI